MQEEVKKDLTAEEASESKKYRLAEIGTALLTDPEANIKSLSEMLQISKSEDRAIVTLGLKSLLAVFKDIIPGYESSSNLLYFFLVKYIQYSFSMCAKL